MRLQHVELQQQFRRLGRIEHLGGQQFE